MTDEEKIRAVTSVLTGEFYVGQHVQPAWSDSSTPGVVTHIWESGAIEVQWRGDSTSSYPYEAHHLKLL